MTSNIPVIPLKVVDQAGNAICKPFGQSVPRMGEGLLIKGVQYRVTDVIHALKPSPDCELEILIYVQDFTQPTPT